MAEVVKGSRTVRLGLTDDAVQTAGVTNMIVTPQVLAALAAVYDEVMGQFNAREIEGGYLFEVEIEVRGARTVKESVDA